MKDLIAIGRKSNFWQLVVNRGHVSILLKPHQPTLRSTEKYLRTPATQKTLLNYVME